MLIDDRRILLWALEKLIESGNPKMKVVAKATSCHEAFALIGEAHPDVILLDIDLGDENVLEAIPELIAKSKARVLALTGLRDPSVRNNAVLAGARGVVGREDTAETILKAIEKVHQGELWLDRITAGRIFVELSRSSAPKPIDPERQRISNLTARERQIVSEIASETGTPIKTIADRLHISEHTLRNHLTSIYEKLGVVNRLDLFVYANKNGILKPPH
jgi:DNA-binding NarL/FixJ family response regulator